jgi:hypothetical protein
VERVRPDRFDQIYDGLLKRLDPRRPVEHFRRIFEYPWRTHEDYVGFALYDEHAPVGFMGLIFSELLVEDRQERLCNVTSFIAKETHRAEAALLPLQLRTLTEYTVTNLTCNDAAYRVFTRVGFKVLDDRKIILRPTWTSFGTRRTGPWGVEHRPEKIRRHLGPEHQQILEHHLPYAKHLLVHRDDRYCYMVFTLGRRRGLRTARIGFISDPSLFAQTWATVQGGLWRQHRAVLAECDSRLLPQVAGAGSRTKAMAIPRLFRSDRLSPEQIPNLYSELILLNLP